MNAQRPPSRIGLLFPIRRRRLLLGSLVLISAVVIGWHLKQPFPASGPTAPAPALETQVHPGLANPEVLRQEQALETASEQIDQTVWAPELEAQRYEGVFVKLWDELRTSEDRIRVLERVPFGELQLGIAAPPERHKDQIRVTRFHGPGRVLDPAAWREFLEAWNRQGFRIEGSEWRQPRFDPDTGAGARSLIAATLHIFNPAQRRRIILQAKLQVRWQKLPEPHADPVPAVVDATDIELIERTGDPAFTEVVTQTIPPAENNFIDPLIVYDLDGDGRSEIILGCRNLVFWNHGRGQFERARLCDVWPGSVNACVIADFDGDGNADFLCADQQGLLLFAGDPRGRFTAPPRRVWSAPEPLPNPFVITAGDIDGDGDLDVWLAQYKLPYVAGQMPTPYYDANDGFPSFLLINDGHGNFRDGTQAAGLAKKRFRRTYSCSLVDLDDDGDLDLVVVSDFAGVDVYWNDGRGHFVDATDSALDESHLFGMAHTFGDYNRDGRLDLFVIGMHSAVAQRLDQLGLGPSTFPDYQALRPRMDYGNRLYLGGPHGFRSAPFNSQVAESGWSWGTTSFDFDNDGDLDLYVANGHKSRASVKDYESQFWRHDIYVGNSTLDAARDLYFRATGARHYGAGESYGGHQHNHLFVNEGGKAFLEAGYLMGVALEADCRNVVSDDLDGDGKLDLLVTTFEEWPRPQQCLRLFQNRLEPSGHWIGLQLREHGPGCSPVGAKVILHSPTGQQTRWLVTGDSYRSQHSGTAHFGLGSETRVTDLEVRWPNGRTNRISNPAVDRYYPISGERRPAQ